MHSLMSMQRAPLGSKPFLHRQVRSAPHWALLVQSKSDWQPVRTSAGSQPTRPSPWNPGGHSHVYPGTRFTQVAPRPQPLRDRLLHSSMSEMEIEHKVLTK